MSNLSLRRHTELLAERLRPAGRRVLDAGCGEGALVAWLRRQNAHALGLDREPRAIAAAAARLGTPRGLVLSTGEALPFRAAALDALIWLNSFHHLPVPAMPLALAEARRVLVAGGDLVVIEPLAEGEYFELLRPIEDETEVRAAAARVLSAAGPGWERLPEAAYGVMVAASSAAVLAARFVAADRTRAAAASRAMPALAAAYARLGRPQGEGREFLQPFRLFHLRRCAGPVLEIQEAVTDAGLRACFAIRLAVFVEEQRVPREAEIDAHDATARHLVATLDGEPIGTLRWRRAAGATKIERVAVLRHRRTDGTGRALVRHLLARLDREGVAASHLHAQVHAAGFYERLGYRPEGEPFLEDDIAHVLMRRSRFAS